MARPALMIAGFPNAIYNRPEGIETSKNVIQSIRAAGRWPASYRIYWYAHRAMEGYFEETGARWRGAGPALITNG